MAYAVQWICVALGFYFGTIFGGNLGAVLGGVLTFAACLLFMDVVVANRPVNGFLLRHRGPFLEFGCVVIGIIVATHFRPGYLAVLMGSLGGVCCGQWLSNRLGWSSDAFSQELGSRLVYLGLLQLLTTGAASGDRRRAELWIVARRLFAELGYDSDPDIESFLRQAHELFNVRNAQQFVANLSREWQLQLAWDALRISYSHVPVPKEKLQLIDTVFEWSGNLDRSIIAEYDRSLNHSPAFQPGWLEELGLKPGASAGEIDVAYRQAVKKFHPDRLNDLPSHLKELAQQKMTRLNSAYRGLKGKQGQTSQEYRFRDLNRTESILEQSNDKFICRCWLCDSSNSIPALASLESARCGNCHALLGHLN